MSIMYSGSKGSFIYRNALNLVGQDKVGTGECVALIQRYVPQIGNTRLWRMGRRAAETTDLQLGTVLANFDNNGHWPGKRHNNHAVFFWKYGPRSMTTGFAMSIFVIEQFNGGGCTKIQARELHCNESERWGSGEWINPSNNGSAFYVARAF